MAGIPPIAMQYQGPESFPPSAETLADFPAPLQPLFEPKRFKVFWGGRGAGRSWGVARALLIEGAKRPLRVLCARELQKSIEESVHRLLSDQITELGLEGHYNVQKNKIEGRNGSSFSFEGIKNNVNKIKSYEGLDVAWVEEANKVSRNSWGVLIPTIRKPGSEIWLTFNPELDTDYTYTRFVQNPSLVLAPANRFAVPSSAPIMESSDSFVVKMTYHDNPWFPKVLEEERLRDKEREGHEDYYLNVWEGHTLQQLEGAVFARELRRAQEENRICSVPWERNFPVDTFWDIGVTSAIWFAQKVGMQIRVLEYYQNSREDINHYLKRLRDSEYTLGTCYLPWDAQASHIGSKLTIEEVIRQAGHKVHIVPRQAVNDRLNAARLILHNCWFDEDLCEDGLKALRRYKYKLDKDQQLSKEPLHDEWSHGADAFGYMALSIGRSRSNSGVETANRLEKVQRAAQRFLEVAAGGLEWMS